MILLLLQFGFLQSPFSETHFGKLNRGGAGDFHDVHLSYLIGTVAGNKVSCKLTYFRDDFDLALKNAFAIDAAKATPIQAKLQVDSAVARYVKTHIKFTANGTLAPEWKFIAIITDDQSRILTFELLLPKGTGIKSAVVENTALFGEYADQQNLLLITTPDGKEQSFIFTRTAKTCSLTF